MNNNILLSIIIPSKVFDKVLIECVDSVKEAILYTKKEISMFEINIILNENNITEAIKHYEDEKYIKIFSQGKDLKGESYARNIGIKNSKSNLLAFFDHDCTVRNDWINQILFSFKKIENSPQIVCILGKHWLYKNYTLWLKLYSKYRERHAVEHFYKENDYILTNRLDGRNFAIYKNIAEKFFFRDDLPTEQDREFGVRLVDNNYKILYNENIVVFHEPLKLVQIFQRQYRYGVGSVKWRKIPNWVYRFYFLHLKRFFRREISLSQLFFIWLCNFFYQLGRLNILENNEKPKKI